MTIEVVEHPAGAERWAAAVRAEGLRLGLVPTMGALHEGHLELVRRAKAECDRVCVSVFVNPLQFDEASDLERYPRDFDADRRLLDGVSCDMVFTGDLAGFFPEEAAAARAAGEAFSVDHVALDDPGPAAEGLEGAHRPGHFAGVATICRRLFELTGAERAYFGAKDFQQTRVVRDVAARLGFPEIVVCDTVREPSGLARSSRNVRLRVEDRERALAISRALQAAWAAWEDGVRECAELERALRAELAELDVEYAVVRDPDRLDRELDVLERGHALVAARVGAVRLIDNHALGGPPLVRAGSGARRED